MVSLVVPRGMLAALLALTAPFDHVPADARPSRGRQPTPIKDQHAAGITRSFASMGTQLL
jgi:hypothetical protein